MVTKVRRHVVGSKDYLILVMDASALKVFSSCCKMFDMYNVGLYHIERLEVARKKYPHTNAIYLISPTLQSIERMIKDF
jgi:syntaxin-binding protein 1